ncbi:ATP-binding cassette domain-containing protein, partial [Acidiphilium sp.]|uniref:ATP-binding cassette domain-containing protein n=1 Tax=Acidiphilium sp. TaxID=527 RepID=UPI003D068AF2
RPRNPRRAIRAGLVMVPEDRKQQGLVLGRSVAENLALSKPQTSGHLGFALSRRLEDAARDWIRRADIRPASPAAVVGELSGGNQQKVLLAKWLACGPKILIVDEPTRGVDVGAKAAIHEMLAQAAASGVGVLLISSELEELLGLAHRIVVFRKGEVVDEVEGEASERERIMTAAFGAAGVGADE